MASAKIRNIEKCKEEVLGICSKYQLNVLDVTSKEIQLDDLNKQYVIDISTDCEDDDIYYMTKSIQDVDSSMKNVCPMWIL